MSRRKPAKRRKPASELTDRGIFQRLFPKPVRDAIKAEAREAEKKGSKGSSKTHKRKRS